MLKFPSIKKLSRYSSTALILMFLAVFVAIFIVFGELSFSSAFDGMVVFHDTVLPAILPFALALAFLKRLFPKKLDELISPISLKLNLSNRGLKILLFGVLSGYPLGATLSIENFKRGNLDKATCEKIAFISSVPSLLLVVTYIGKIGYGSFKIGVICFLAQILSSLFTYRLFKHDKSQLPIVSATPKQLDFFDEVFSVVKSILINGALTVFFYTVANVILAITPLKNLRFYPVLLGAVSGIIETNFATNILTHTHSLISISTCNGVLAFGGIGGFLLTDFTLKPIKIRTTKLLFFKISQSLICFIFTYLFCFLLPI